MSQRASPQNSDPVTHDHCSVADSDQIPKFCEHLQQSISTMETAHDAITTVLMESKDGIWISAVL